MNHLRKTTLRSRKTTPRSRIKTLHWSALIVILLLLITPTAALAQNYLFKVDDESVDVYINADGSEGLEYLWTFTNLPGSHTIDFVDVGMPNNNFSVNDVSADVDGTPVSVSSSDYQGNGSGFAVVLGGKSIRPGASGKVHVLVNRIDSWLKVDSKDSNYASLEFKPTYFGQQYVQGNTALTVTYHLPPGVKPDEPRWHNPSEGFPSEPVTGFDDQGRITYTWTNNQGRAYAIYDFGASFPKQYVPAGAVTTPSFAETLGIDPGTLSTCFCFAAVLVFIGGIGYTASRSANRRKLQYLPPKIAIEGMGIKRGLTAVEAAILMEQPVDKVMTMILFGLVKKGAAQVTQQDPLTIQPVTPAPAELTDYEQTFLAAFQQQPRERRAALQNMFTDLIKSVANKMKGFSRQETVAYYKDIMERAWQQVEAGQTPEVKMEAFDKYMEWTMLDRQYDDRTRRVFTGPVIVPTWWGRYDPTYHPMGGGIGHTSAAPVSVGKPGGGGGGGFSMPTLPGSAFAASMVHGVQNFSSGVVGNLTDFTSTITNRTNPPPPPAPATRSGGWGGGGGGHSCACACACAGCACACAGGGR